MSSKLRFFLIAIICFFISTGNTSAQDNATKWPPKKWPHDAKNCHHILSNSFQCKWRFFEIKAPLDGIVIACSKVTGKTDPLTCASVSILKAGKDTMRVILIGNVAYKAGDHVKVTQGKEPESDITVPLDRDYYMAEEKAGNKPTCRINEYDSRILKTAWGKIVQ